MGGLSRNDQGWVDKHCGMGILEAPRDRTGVPLNFLQCREAASYTSKAFVYYDQMCYVYKEPQNFNLVKMSHLRPNGQDHWTYCVSSQWDKKGVAVGETGTSAFAITATASTTADDWVMYG